MCVFPIMKFEELVLCAKNIYSFSDGHVLGIDIQSHDVRFVEDNWESPVMYID